MCCYNIVYIIASALQHCQVFLCFFIGLPTPEPLASAEAEAARKDPPPPGADSAVEPDYQ
jgi:hypothetical protein